jgi:hypothetical protein
MPAAAWMTLVVGAVIILVIAVALFRVIYHLSFIRGTLGTVVVGAQVVAHQTRTVPDALTSVNANLKPVRDFCETV